VAAGGRINDTTRTKPPATIADVKVVDHSDAGSLIFPERFLISGLISGAARG
jgi:hypothetical protein